MPRFKGQVSNFSAGALSPGAQDRIEAAVWNAGAETLENVLVRRGGGIRTRPGLRIARLDDEVTGRPLPVTRELFQSPQRWRTWTGGTLIEGQYQEGSLGFGKDPARTGTFTEPTQLGYVRAPMLGISDWSVFIDRVPISEGGGRGVGTGTYTAAVGFTGTLDGHPVDVQWDPANAAGYTQGQWEQVRFALRMVEVDTPHWPIRTLTLRDLRLTLPGRDALTWYRTGDDYYAAYALWGQIAGIPDEWYSLTRMGPYDGLWTDITGRKLYANALTVLDQSLSPAFSFPLRPGTVAAGTWTPLTTAQLARANAYTLDEDDGPDAIAYSRIALVELGLGRTGQRGVAPGQVGWSIGGVSAGFNTRLTLQGTDSQAAQDAAGDRRLAPPPADRSHLRLVEWTPAPGVQLLVTLYPSGIEVTQVTAAGQPLQVVAKLPVDLSVLEGRLDEVVAAPSEGALYLFHEALTAPQVLTRTAAGRLTVSDMTFTSASVILPGQPDTGMRASVPHADYADPDTVYWRGDGEGIRGGVFVYGRLALFGSGKHPNMIAFSAVGDPTRFVPDAGGVGADADQPFHALTAGAENLHAGLLGRRLVAFGENAEYFLPAEEISGRTLAFRKTSDWGSPRGGRALNVGDAIVFRQADPTGRAGVDMRMMVFSDEESGFRTPSLAPFSEHLVRDIDAYAYQPGAQDGGARLWCVRRDGHLSVLTIDRAAQVNAWAGQRLPVEAFEVASIADRVFVYARLGDAPRLMEVSYSDTTGSVLDLPIVVDAWTRGHAIKIPPELQDTYPDGTELTVISSHDVPFRATVMGSVVPIEPDTLTEGARVEAGLPVQWTVRTLPFVPRTSTGTAVAVQKTRVLRTMVDFETTPLAEPPILPILRINETETARPSRIDWPRFIEVENTQGIWIPAPVLPSADTERLVQAKLGARRGWRNRTTVAIRGRMPCAIVGLSWMVAGSG